MNSLRSPRCAKFHSSAGMTVFNIIFYDDFKVCLKFLETLDFLHNFGALTQKNKMLRKVILDSTSHAEFKNVNIVLKGF